MALGCIAALAVGIAVGMALRSVQMPDPETGELVLHYGWFEVILTSVFCAAPVFLLGAWWSGRRLIPDS